MELIEKNSPTETLSAEETATSSMLAGKPSDTVTGTVNNDH